MFSHTAAAALAVGLGLTTALLAQSSPEILDVAFTLNGVEKSIRQTETLDTAQVSAFHKPGPNCGEREVIRFIADKVALGEGLLIDSRQPEDRAARFITASVNVPYSLLQPDNPYVADIMQALGARAFEGTLNFSDAMPLVVFDDGPTTNDASTFIAALIAAGYPAEKLSYYRGGMLVWTALGLNTQDSKS